MPGPDRTRTFTWTDPLATARAAQGRSGLAFLHAILDGTIAPPPISAALDFALIAADDGVARFRGQPGEYHYNPMGSVHGGYAATLLDSAMGSAVMTALDATEMYATVGLSIYLVRPINLSSGPLVAEGRLVHRGKRVATADGRLTDSAGHLVAHGTTSCAIAPRP